VRVALVAGIAALVMTLAPMVAAASPIATIHLEKTCGATGDTLLCTITVSDYPAILVGSTVRYTGLPLDGSGYELNSGLTLTTYGVGGGITGTVNGHCTFSWVVLTGACVFGDGSGTLAGFRASMHEVLTDLQGPPYIVSFALDGIYRIGL
jgi:FlaG/FlaF family flagellin (archaellin)